MCNISQPTRLRLPGCPLRLTCFRSPPYGRSEGQISQPNLRGRYFTDPVGVDIFEALSAGDIVDDDDGVGSLVVGSSDGAESFLACRVPDLELDYFSLHGQRSLCRLLYLKRKSTPIVAR
jgi:hypothetical protein